MKLPSMVKGWFNPTISPEILITRYIATSKDKYFTLLVKQFNQPIYHYLLSQSDKETAEDIIQSMWLKVMNIKASHPVHSNVKSWLFTIARNTLIDELRRQNRWQTQSLDEQGAATDIQLLSQTNNHSLEQQFEYIDRLALFNRAITLLPFYQREAFIFQQEGFSLEQIAELTGESFETIKSRLRYARTYIKNLLEDKS
ncbi:MULTISPECIES: sigma-70 family RNA polymerase sigma factor [unclassified Colwellia]|uniref:sigma-70 family RNA polymerase sigma factor n=1 Tax=unclassified Colwellia TaxID=196834 RepID=UPI0015F76E37|nr:MULTISPECIES: sigma-70 family RNA polymerase sigma factor [unclassified Colwellia]MBA6352586.1 sigma-70 family RNA polymerase sigma factor [Colwellia sp. BRX9-1]MBA6371961.1 sigma-70 family RNA polymerase sigma factor [Colwellia sp. BRX8-4]MBA6377866.1 sigma-70 family RNA polymerase sigma factor [Colwellia sp. BRX10-7]MBA6388234.1 sigma-70 family RNA polymerase sigma factor [Colwellia sp. BRX10-2]MBA6400874.1 sigma-70 family RNA polymerase sigma factor [Colwellia sp. BRX10-5]